MIARTIGLLGLLAALGSCATPPASAYLDASGDRGGGVGLGRDAAGEGCSLAGGAIFCGTWRAPSAYVRDAGPADGAPLAAIATTGAWRSALDARFSCGPAVGTAIVDGIPAVELSCRRHVGGWPQVALAAVIGGRLYTADGILPSEPVMERAIGVLSGRVSPSAAPALPPGNAAGLLAARLASEPFSAGDVGRYNALMDAGQRANLDENYPAAEQAYRAALAIQEHALGPADPGTLAPILLIAVQLADEGRGAEAATLFDRAARLAPHSSDPLATATLDYDEALARLDGSDPGAALALFRRAEGAYAGTLPGAMLATGAPASGTAGTAAGGALPVDPTTQRALIGVVEARRYEAICLRELGHATAARERIGSALRLADAEGLRQPDLTARLLRTEGEIADRAQPGSGTEDLAAAARAFGLAQPGSRPVAETDFLRAGEALRRDDRGHAVAFCRAGVSLLDQLRAGTTIDAIEPCLEAYAAASSADPQQRQALLAAMFDTAQLVQDSVTSRQIALAAARLAAGSKDQAVGRAIRRQQDAALALAAAEQAHDLAVSSGDGATADAALERRVATARQALDDADAVLQAASPNYGQLVQEVVPARAVLAALAPGEAFVGITLTPDRTWIFALHDGRIDLASSGAGLAAVAGLVRGVRASVEPGPAGLAPFDVADASALYADTIGPVAPALAGDNALVVAPSGPLLALPFELLLSGPADAGALGTAPFLVRRFAISHVPAAANFVALRHADHRAGQGVPWFGFGDARPVTLAQAQATFPSGACADSARLFAGLPSLPFAGRELAAARALLGGSASDMLTGTAFTRDAVLQADLDDVRVLHFATHALLPTDLTCEPEPAVVTSAPAGAPNANGALLTATDIATMKLDADLVILSACNSAGPDGSPAGESLSGLARSFFYAGARSVMATHWSINDQSTAFLVADTLERLHRGNPLGLAGALQGAQIALLDGAGHGGMAASLADPFFWAPFAVVGEGRVEATAPAAGSLARL